MKNVIIVLAALLLIGGCSYNSMVKPNNEVNNAWSEVQNQYQRRSDLVGNLVETVKGAANFEQKTLTDVIEARAKATAVTVDPTNITPEKLAEFQQAQGQLSQAMGRLMVVSEQYPNLKANENFRDLQVQLEGTENRVTKARENFNEKILNYNNVVTTFPRNIIGSIFGFKAKEGFKADQASQNAPKVKF